MAAHFIPSLKSPAGFLLLAATASITLATPSSAQLNASAPTPAKSPTFEVVSIKPHELGDDSMSWRTTLDGFSASNVSPESLIRSAFHLIMPEQISGLPGWASSDTFDVQAKMDEDTAAAMQKLPREEHVRQLDLMMQAVLFDRFQLKVHHETKELPVYDLMVAKNGIKMTQATANVNSSWSMGDGRFEGKSVPIDSFIFSLSNDVGRFVINKTGLTGNVAITLKWAPEGAEGSADSGPDIFAAIEEQLGLKLLPAKGPVDTIVVDHIEKPSVN
jgi:uncharacterized protein (TIGR03435 family)